MDLECCTYERASFSQLCFVCFSVSFGFFRRNEGSLCSSSGHSCHRGSAGKGIVFCFFSAQNCPQIFSHAYRHQRTYTIATLALGAGSKLTDLLRHSF